MKASILLADAAAAHPDGTFSVLRGGINIVTTPKTQPVTFQGALVVRVVGTLSENGPHDLRVRVLNADGQSIAPDITLQFKIPEGGGAVQLVAPFAFILPGYGRYSFSVTVDRQEQDSWEVNAVPPSEPKTSAGGGTKP